MYMPTSVASMESILSSLPGVHDALCNYVMPIHFINGKKLKSCRASLTNHTGSTYIYHTISHHWLLIALRVDKNTYTHTYAPTHTQKQKQF